ncbi:MAG TPA: hypothetical protein PLN52_24740, partial [Opitutaceae bacterium]|nr:hypothetical protein [Opitutaceae bacterium]
MNTRSRLLKGSTHTFARKLITVVGQSFRSGVCLFVVWAMVALHAQVPDWVNADSLGATYFSERPLRPSPTVRQGPASALANYPETDVLFIGNNGTPFVLRGEFGKVTDAASGISPDNSDRIAMVVAPLVGLRAVDLALRGIANDPNGMKHVAFDVRIGTLEVTGASVIAHIARNGNLTSVSATVPDDPSLPTSSISTDAEAAKANLSSKIARILGRTSAPKLVYFLPAQNQPTFLAWEFGFNLNAQSEDLIYKAYVDAKTGQVLEVRDQIQRAKNRSVADLNGAVGYNSSTNMFFTQNVVSRAEGDSSVAAQAVNDAYDNTGRAYDYFKNTHGYDGPNGGGAQI